MSRPGFTPYVPLWTKPGGTGDKRFFPGTGALKSADAKSVLLALELYAAQGDITVQIGVQESDDGIVWPFWNATPVPVGAITLNIDGVVYDASYATLTLGKSYFRLGFLCWNTSASTTLIQHALGALRYDLRSC